MNEESRSSSRLLKEIREEKEKILTPEYRYALGIIADRMHKEKHFIRELIQNADDARSRKILFELDTRNRVVRVTNYGNPFDEKDVRQVCTMLPSGKKSTQIGTLGVGFKSVFGISDCPKIFSGFFCFQIRDYVLPEEIETATRAESNDSTVFIIPIREDVNIESVLSRFDSIDAEMILFLNNISELKVIFDGSVNYTIKKRIVSWKKFRELRIQHLVISEEHDKSKIESCFVVAKRRYNIPEDLRGRIREVIRSEMQRIYQDPVRFFGSNALNERIESKIPRYITPTIAILTTKNWNFERMVESRLFIGLPTETKTGLRFHVNAEFKPSADRSGIERDEINKWIILKLGEAICEMIEFMKAVKKHERRFYCILPDLEDVARIDDKDLIYDNVFSAIKEYSKRHPIILTSSNTWGKQGEVCLSEHREIEQLLKEEDLEKSFGKRYYVSSHLAPNADAFLRSIEIAKITLKDFIDFLSKEVHLANKSPIWFLGVYAYLGKHLDKDRHREIIEKLSHSKVLVTATEAHLAPCDEKTFLPSYQELQKSYDLFKDEVNFIHKDIVVGLAKKDQTSKWARHFLNLMGVRNYTPFYLIENIILPKYETESWKKESTTRLFEYVDFIRNHIKEYERDAKFHALNKSDPLTRLRNSLYIRTNHTENETNYYDRASNLYLPSLYTKEKGLEILFAGFKTGKFVHSMYLEKSNGKDKRSWVEFFKKLGAEDKPRIKVVLEKETYDPSKRRDLVSELEWAERSAYGWMEHIQYDKISDDIEEILRYAESLPFKERKSRIERLIKTLDRNWSKYVDQVRRQIEDTWETKQYKTLDSSKWEYHKQYWREKRISSSLKRLLSSSSLPTTQNMFAKPNEIYVNDPEFVALIGKDANFLTLVIAHEELIDLLGVNKKARAEGIIKHLLSISKTNYIEEKAKFLLKRIDNPRDLGQLVTEIGKEDICEGIIRLASLAYQNVSIKILDSERSDHPIYDEDWWNTFKDNVKILAKDRGFYLATKVRFPPPPYLSTILARSGIEKVPLLPDDWRQYETFARYVGVRELEYGIDVKCKLVEPVEAEIREKRSQFEKFETMVKDAIPYANGAEAKRILHETDRWDYSQVFASLKAYSIETLKVQYLVEDGDGAVCEGVPISTPVYLRQAPDGNELYIREDAKHDKHICELVANELSLLTNPKGDKDYMAKTLKECLLGFPPLDIERIEALSQPKQIDLTPLTPSVEALTDTPPPMKVASPTVEVPAEEQPVETSPTVEVPTEEKKPTNQQSDGTSLLDEKPIPVFPEETRPNAEQPPSGSPREPIKTVAERQIRDSRMADWVKGSYGYNCQVCLPKEKPEVLAYYRSYAGKESNKRLIMESHHVMQIARDQGHDHVGNYLCLCRYHHTLLHKLGFSLDDLKDSLNSIVEKEIVWPNGKTVAWKMVTLNDAFVEKNEPIQIVFNNNHLEKLKEYIGYIYS